MRAKILLVLLLTLTARMALADNVQRKTEITIYSGWSFLDATNRAGGCLIICVDPPVPVPFPGFAIINEQKVKSSVLFGFKAGEYLNPHMELEGNFAIAPHHRFEQSIRVECSPGEICPLIALPDFLREQNFVAYNYDGNFVYHFVTGNIRPFLDIGAGGVSTDTENGVRTNFAFNFGGGAKFYLGKIGLRFELNDHLIPNYFLTEKTENDLQLQYGIVFGL
jgi:Outer membrane protein beta-barrel domain